MMLKTQEPSHLKEKYHLANIALHQGKWAEAETLLEALWQQLPQIHEIGFKLGIAQMSIDKWTAAITNFERLFAAGLNDAALACNLGIAYWKNAQLRQALIYFRYNLRHYPHHAETHLNLANLYLDYQHFKSAIRHYHILVYHYPNNLEYRFNLAASLQKYGIIDEAIMHYNFILTQTPVHLDTLYNLACIYWQLQDYARARYFCVETLKHRHHQELVFIRKQIDHEQITPEEYQAYVHELFENYATHYNFHMQKTLKYSIPKLLNQHLKHMNQTFAHVLDLGCGTGLAAKALRPFSKKLYGLDCVKTMLDEAQKTKLYNELIHMDALKFLTTYEKKFDLIVALELMPYILEPQDFFQQISHRLSPKGHFIFTYEIGQDSLQDNARMAFSQNLIEKCTNASGFSIKQQEIIQARLNKDAWLDMMLVHLQKESSS